jgi:two-component system, NarL family, sensor histidine kinase DevS
MASDDVLDVERLRRLLAAGRSLVADLDLESVLDRVLEIAREVTGARYAALGVLDEQRSELERFLTVGIDEATHRVIGELPHGRGILGVLIDEPQPLRLDSVGSDPRSYGFPPGHPPMETFLGVPVLIRGEAWGNLYLTDRADGEPFGEADEETATILAEWAAIAIENARLYEGVAKRREELERAVRRLEATTTIARAVGGETDLSRVLELIVKRGRALVDAQGVLILLRDGPGLVVAATAGEVPAGVEGSRLDSPGASIDVLGLDPASALTVPLVFRGQSLGLLAALGRRDGGALGAEDERLLIGFAASAATAVATARTVEAQRLREAIQGAEEERRRWARELHDETLQGLGALRLVLSSGRRGDDPDRLRAAVDEAVSQLEGEIDGLRSLIRELRPAALDELGPVPAIDDLAGRTAARHGVDVTTDIRLAATARHAPEVDITLYRIIQEALNNAVKHAGAGHVAVSVSEDRGLLHIRVGDDGRGFDPSVTTTGFGLAGMRERVGLLGGELEIASSEAGTVVSASLPLRA